MSNILHNSHTRTKEKRDEKSFQIFRFKFCKIQIPRRIQNRVLKKNHQNIRDRMRHKFLHFRLIYNFELCKGRSWT